MAAYHALRPLKEIASARQEGRQDDNLVYLLPQSAIPGATRKQTLAFFVDEVTESFGGLAKATLACHDCPNNTAGNDRLAGCTGFVIAGDLEQLSQQTRELESRELPLSPPRWQAQSTVPETWDKLLRRYLPESNHEPPRARLAWYELVRTSLIDSTLRISAVAPADVPAPLQELEQTLQRWVAGPNQFQLHLEHIPRGFSDGHQWWLGPHCSRCHFPLTEDSRHCPQCHHNSAPVPVSRRRVMGWNPYWPLTALVDPASAQQLSDRWSNGSQRS